MTIKLYKKLFKQLSTELPMASKQVPLEINMDCLMPISAIMVLIKAKYTMSVELFTAVTHLRAHLIVLVHKSSKVQLYMEVRSVKVVMEVMLLLTYLAISVI